MRTIKMPFIFQDKMMLQRQKKVKIWGKAEAFGFIEVKVLDENTGEILSCGEALSSAEGEFTVWLDEMEANSAARMEICSGEEKLCLREIAIGEVWIAGGQSNMEFAMKYDADRHAELLRAENREIRFFDVPHIGNEILPEIDQMRGVWRICKEQELLYFSAVGYYFARNLQDDLKVPVGIVGCNWGGTSALVWMPPETVEKSDCLKKYKKEYEDRIKDIDWEQYKKDVQSNRLAQAQAEYDFYEQIVYGVSRQQQLCGYGFKEPRPSAKTKMLAVDPWNPQIDQPSSLYRTMLSTILGYSMRGVIWYQGESDVDRADDYEFIFTSLVQSLREIWQEEFPWLFVQLAPFYKWLDAKGKKYPKMRKIQEKISKTLPNTGMISIMDAGEKWDIHPKRKQIVGARLALMARGMVYGEDILYLPPECIGVSVEENRITIEFANAGKRMRFLDRKQDDFYAICNGKKIPLLLEGCKGYRVTAVLSEKTQGKIEAVELMEVPYTEALIYNEAWLPVKPFTWKL